VTRSSIILAPTPLVRGATHFINLPAHSSRKVKGKRYQLYCQVYLQIIAPHSRITGSTTSHCSKTGWTSSRSVNIREKLEGRQEREKVGGKVVRCDNLSVPIPSSFYRKKETTLRQGAQVVSAGIVIVENSVDPVPYRKGYGPSVG